MENQVIGESLQKILAKRGWTSTDKKVYTKGHMSIRKDAGNKFSKCHLEENGEEILVDGELNYVIAYADGRASVAGQARQQEPTPAPTPEPEMVQTPGPIVQNKSNPKKKSEPYVPLDQVDKEPGWIWDKEER